MVQAVFATLLALTVSSVALAGINITEDEVLDAQKRWGDGIVRIGEVKLDGEETKVHFTMGFIKRGNRVASTFRRAICRSEPKCRV